MAFFCMAFARYRTPKKAGQAGKPQKLANTSGNIHQAEFPAAGFDLVIEENKRAQASRINGADFREVHFQMLVHKLAREAAKL